MSDIPKKRKRKRSKVKAAKVVKSLISNDLNKSAAARELGVSPQAVKKQVDTNPLVKKGLENYLAELDKAGATEEKSARVIAEAMDAKVTRVIRVVGGEDGERETITEDDHYARLKANEQYLKVKRLLNVDENDEALRRGTTLIIKMPKLGVPDTELIVGQNGNDRRIRLN